jgi:hypothetical protein
MHKLRLGYKQRKIKCAHVAAKYVFFLVFASVLLYICIERDEKLLSPPPHAAAAQNLPATIN